MQKKEPKMLVPREAEVIKNRDFGRVSGVLTRHQRVAFASFIKNAYEQMIENDNPVQRYFEVPLEQFKEELGIEHRNIFSESDDPSNNRFSLETTIKQLMQKTLSWRYKNKKGKILSISSSMLSYFEINGEKQIVRYSLGTFLQDKIVCYGNAYILQMPILASLRSGYSVALYDLLEQRRDFLRWRVSVEELRDLMGVQPEEYASMTDFRRYVIEPAIKEIIKIAKYRSLQYSTEKKARSITHFYFIWQTASEEREDRDIILERAGKWAKKYILRLTDGKGGTDLYTLSKLSYTETGEVEAIFHSINHSGEGVKTEVDNIKDFRRYVREKLIDLY